MPSGCEKVKFGLLRKQLSLGSLTRKISRSSQGSTADAEEGCIRKVAEKKQCKCHVKTDQTRSSFLPDENQSPNLKGGEFTQPGA